MDGRESTGSPHCDKKTMVGQASSASATLAWRILDEAWGAFLSRRTEVILLHLSFLRGEKQEQAALPFRDGSHRRLGRGLAPSSRHSSLWYWKKPPVRLQQMPVSCSISARHLGKFGSCCRCSSLQARIVYHEQI